MANLRTGIEWTDATWNPTSGCSNVSTGCKHCYAERLFSRVYPGRDFTDVQYHPDRLDQPLRWKKPRRVFVNSMSDLFHEDVPLSFIAWVFNYMLMAPHHTYQVLTKRPERLGEFINWMARNYAKSEGDTWLEEHAHIWLGVSIEDQETANERIPILLQTPAAVRFLSVEPLLGPIDLSSFVGEGTCPDRADQQHCEHWYDGDNCCGCRWKGEISLCIVGGESGPNARPMEESWARLIRDQCQDADVPFFFKQGSQANWPDYKNFESFPQDLQIREFPA